jgi:hypothetical protein
VSKEKANKDALDPSIIMDKEHDKKKDVKEEVETFVKQMLETSKLSSKEEDDKVFAKHRERMSNFDKDERKM